MTMNKQSTAMMLAYLVTLTQYISQDRYHTTVTFLNHPGGRNMVEFVIYGGTDCSTIAFYDNELGIVCQERVRSILDILKNEDEPLEEIFDKLYQLGE